MPVLNGKQTAPSGARSAKLKEVVLELVDGLGNPVRNAYETATGRAIGGSEPATLNSDGTWTITVPGHDGITPSGTYWRKRALHEGAPASEATLLLSNTGGPYNEDDITVDLGDVPTTTPSNEVDSAEITDNVGPLTINTLQLDAVAGLTVTVPDLAVPVWLEADVACSHTVANAAVNPAIAPVGSTVLTETLGQGQELLGAIGTVAMCRARARLAPHSPGDYGVFVSGTAGDLTVVAETYAPGRLTALAV